ncbi:unnamed protein product, partial [Sphacelaria rigidula]
MCLRLLARYKSECKKAPPPECFSGIYQHAEISATLILSIRGIVPQGEWTNRLTKEINKLAFESYSSYGTWVQPHFEELKEEVDALVKKIAPGDKTVSSDKKKKEIDELEGTIKAVVACKPMHRVRKVLQKDPKLRTYLATWDGKYQDIINRVDLVHAHNAMQADDDGSIHESDTGSGSEDDGEDDP